MKVEEPIQVVITGSDSQKGANREIAQAISKIHELKQAANPEKDVVVTLFSKDKGPKKIYNVGKKSKCLSKLIIHGLSIPGLFIHSLDHRLSIPCTFAARITINCVLRKWIEKGFTKNG